MPKQYKCIFLLGIIMTLVTGCSNEVWTIPSMIGEVDLSVDPDSLETDYSVPDIYPNIYVKINGYDVTEKKEIAMQGDVLPEEVGLYRQDADGNLELVDKYFVTEKRTSEKGYIGLVDFTEIDKPGKYQIKAGPLGESYWFDISEKNYSDSIQLICQDMKENLTPKSAYILLEAYELFPNAFNIEWDKSNGGDSNLLEMIGSFIEKNDFDRDPYWASLLAKYALIKEGVDNQAELTTKAKEKIGRLSDISKPTEGYACLHTESYRLTGLETEGSLMTEYYRMKLNESDILNESDFLGALVYMNTRRDINIQMSGGIMKSIIRKSEDILNSYKGNMLLDAVDEEKYNQIIDDAMVLSTVNHIIPAFEYGVVVARQYNYLCGRNEEHKTINVKEDSVRAAKMVYITAHLATIDDVVIDLFDQEN